MSPRPLSHPTAVLPDRTLPPLTHHPPWGPPVRQTSTTASGLDPVYSPLATSADASRSVRGSVFTPGDEPAVEGEGRSTNRRLQGTVGRIGRVLGDTHVVFWNSLKPSYSRNKCRVFSFELKTLPNPPSRRENLSEQEWNLKKGSNRPPPVTPLRLGYTITRASRTVSWCPRVSGLQPRSLSSLKLFGPDFLTLHKTNLRY